jgi:UDP-glucose 4-epimerase
MDLKSGDAGQLADSQVVVTGGAGFIGSHLVDRLVDVGAEVTVVDDLSEGSMSNLSRVEREIEFTELDITDRSDIAEVLQNQRLVFHLAANADVPRSVERPTEDFEINATGTQVVLDEGRKAGIKKVVFASSAAVYGPPEYTPIDETHPLNPVSPYGASKLAGERLGMAYSATYDLDVTALRIFNTFGPRQLRYVMFDFLRKLDEDPTRLEVLGSGDERRTFAYVSDTVAALLTLAVRGETPGEVYNFGGSSPTQIRDLAELMADRFYDGTPEIETTKEPKPGDISVLETDNSKIATLGVTPTVELADGLDRLYEWYQDESLSA